MARAAVAAWVACISDLQQLFDGVFAPGAPDSTPAANSAATHIFVHSLTQLQRHSPLPHAAWKKLVEEVQVMCPCSARDLQCWQALSPCLSSVFHVTGMPLSLCCYRFSSLAGCVLLASPAFWVSAGGQGQHRTCTGQEVVVHSCESSTVI
jgi:hypothetical protein